MKWIAIAAGLVGAVAACAAAAQDDWPAPNATERGWIAACVKKNTDEAAAEKACVAVVLGACLGLDDAPKSIKPSDQNGHPRSCAPVEQKIWDELLNRWYAEALKKVPAAAQDKLRAAERAWIPYRDATCAVDEALRPFPMGADDAATCLMSETARRALELRALAAADYDNP